MSAVAAASGGKDMLPLCKCSRAYNFKDGCSARPGQRQTTMAETFSFHIIILTIIIDNIKVYYSLTSPHTVWGLLPEYFLHISHSYPTDHPLLHEIPSMYPHLSGRPWILEQPGRYREAQLRQRRSHGAHGAPARGRGVRRRRPAEATSEVGILKFEEILVFFWGSP